MSRSVHPSDGGCWFCHRVSEEVMVYTCEFDAYFHPSCLGKRPSNDPEARVVRAEHPELAMSFESELKQRNAIPLEAGSSLSTSGLGASSNSGLMAVTAQSNLDQMVTKTCRELCEFYKDDKIAPGVHIAWLPDKSKWYASCQRFKNGVDSRQIMSKGLEDTAFGAMSEAYRIWRDLADVYLASVK